MSLNGSHPLSRRAGVTLVEILVVVVILAVLAAILFPVFARAKAAARKTVCLSNLGTIQKAVAVYAGDADNLAPPGPTTGNDCARVRLRYDADPIPAERILARYGAPRAVWRCPDETFVGALEGDFLVYGATSEKAFDICGSSYWLRTTTPEKPLPIPGASDVALAFDIWDFHFGKTNYVFADGHAKSTPFSDRTKYFGE